MEQQDTFYKVPKRLWKDLLIESKNIADSVRIDEKPSSSFSRRESNLTFDDALKLLNGKSHFVFIHRRRHFPIQPEHIETGFCTIDKTEPAIYVFIDIDLKKLDYFVQKYKMIPMN